MMDRALRARIGAARILLEGHNGGSSHKAVSAIQMAAILDMVATQKLNSSEKAEVCELMLEATRYDGDLPKVLGELAEDVGWRRRVKRRTQQDFEAIMMYGNRPFWDRMMSKLRGKTGNCHC